MTEPELVARARAGDQDAFEQLVLDNQNRIYTLTFRMVNDREEAADLAQEAFLKAWQALPNFQGESSFSTWIYRLTTNLCIDFLRRQKRRQGVENVLSLDDPDGGWAEPADPGQDPQGADHADIAPAHRKTLIQPHPEQQRRKQQVGKMRVLSSQRPEKVVCRSQSHAQHNGTGQPPGCLRRGYRQSLCHRPPSLGSS